MFATNMEKECAPELPQASHFDLTYSRWSSLDLMNQSFARIAGSWCSTPPVKYGCTRWSGAGRLTRKLGGWQWCGCIHGRPLQLEVVLLDKTCEVGIGHALHLQHALQWHVMHVPIMQALWAHKQIAWERMWTLQAL